MTLLTSPTTLIISGCKIEIFEPNQNSGKDPVVCFPGMLYQKVFEMLCWYATESGRKVIIITPPNHYKGNMDLYALGRMGFKDCFDPIIAAMANLGLDLIPHVVIGFSAGGLYAQKIVKEGKFKIRAGIFVASDVPKGVWPISTVALLSRIWYYLPEILLGKPFQMCKSDFVALMANKCSEAERNELFEKLDPGSGALARELVFSPPQISGEPSCPTKVVAFTEDRTVSVRSQKSLVKNLGSGCSLVKLEADHFGLLKPGIARAILEELKAIPV